MYSNVSFHNFILFNANSFIHLKVDPNKPLISQYFRKLLILLEIAFLYWEVHEKPHQETQSFSQTKVCYLHNLILPGFFPQPIKLRHAKSYKSQYNMTNGVSKSSLTCCLHDKHNFIPDILEHY